MTTPSKRPKRPKRTLSHLLRQLLRQARNLDPLGVWLYLIHEVTGITFGFIFCLAAYMNEYRAVFLMGLLMLVIGFSQSTIQLTRQRNSK